MHKAMHKAMHSHTPAACTHLVKSHAHVLVQGVQVKLQLLDGLCLGSGDRGQLLKYIHKNTGGVMGAGRDTFSTRRPPRHKQRGGEHKLTMTRQGGGHQHIAAVHSSGSAKRHTQPLHGAHSDTNKQTHTVARFCMAFASPGVVRARLATTSTKVVLLSAPLMLSAFTRVSKRNPYAPPRFVPPLR
jgi:hypothetical protein